jgi:hypothetical protein
MSNFVSTNALMVSAEILNGIAFEHVEAEFPLLCSLSTPFNEQSNGAEKIIK